MPKLKARADLMASQILGKNLNEKDLIWVRETYFYKRLLIAIEIEEIKKIVKQEYFVKPIKRIVKFFTEDLERKVRIKK